MKTISFILIAVFSFCFLCPVASYGQTRPNIVFILADDLGYGDLGCYGADVIKTPNIDALAKSGMRFTDFYAGSTVCAPSRASLMTGQHTGTTYIRGNGEVPLRETDTILPQRLKSAGYATAMVGKWGLGQAGTTGAPERKGWDYFSGLLHHVEGHYQWPDSAWQMINGTSQRIRIPGNKPSNEWFKDEAVRFIHQTNGQPFFLYVSFTLPHAELVVPQHFLQQYLDSEGRSIFEKEVPQKSGLHYGRQEFPKAAYTAMVTQMDSYVGQIMAALHARGLADNTIVIFTSDNGTHVEGGRTRKDVELFRSSGPFRGVKRDLYEGGIRVPFIVSWNKLAAPGTESSHYGAFWDVVPTLCAAAGIHQKNLHADGNSFLPTLLGASQKPHDYLYWEFYEGGFKQAVRRHQWKAIRFFRGKSPERTELYNLANDRGETRDVSKDHPEIVAEMEIIMNRQHLQTGHPLFRIQ